MLRPFVAGRCRAIHPSVQNGLHPVSRVVVGLGRDLEEVLLEGVQRLQELDVLPRVHLRGVEREVVDAPGTGHQHVEDGVDKLGLVDEIAPLLDNLVEVGHDTEVGVQRRRPEEVRRQLAQILRPLDREQRAVLGNEDVRQRRHEPEGELQLVRLVDSGAVLGVDERPDVVHVDLEGAGEFLRLR